MIKNIVIIILIFLPSISLATQDRYAEILETSMSGNLIKPFKKFALHISLNPENKAVQHIDLSIDGRPANISIPKKYNVNGVVLSELKVTHSPIHAPNAEANGIIGIGPAYLTILYYFYPAKSCDSDVGEISISTRMDTLEYKVEGECVEEPHA